MARSELGRQLNQLQTADLIRLVQSEPELEYWFKHAAIQEAVYSSLLKSTRAELHSRVAEAIAASLPAEAADRAAMLALHFERAGRPREALLYAVEAGDRARRSYALHEAIGFYDRALAVAGRLPDSELADAVHQAYSGRGQALQSLGQNQAALECFQQMLAAAKASGHQARQVEALNRLLPLQVLLRGFTPEVESQLDEALRLAEEIAEPLLCARTFWNVGLAFRFQDPPRAISYLERALAVTDSSVDGDERMLELHGHILNDLGITMWVVGHLAKGYIYTSKAVEVFRRLDHRSMLADALGGTGWMLWLQGDPAMALLAVREGLQVSLAIENTWAATYNYFALAMMAMDAGRLEEAFDLGQRGLASAHAAGFPAFVGMVQTAMSDLYFQLGNADLGQLASTEAVTAFEAMHAPVWDAMARAIAGRAALERGALEEAWETVRPLTEDNEARWKDLEANIFFGTDVLRVAFVSGHLAEGLQFCDWFIPLLEREGAFRAVGWARYWCGRTRARLGDLEAAEAQLLQAHAILLKANADRFLWQVHHALSETYAAQGAPARARQHHEQAVEIIQRLAAGISDHELRGRFLEHPDVARVLRA